MGEIFDLEVARRRRMMRQCHQVLGHWWNLWFLPVGLTQEALARLTPEERRWGGRWSPGRGDGLRLPDVSGVQG